MSELIIEVPLRISISVGKATQPTSTAPGVVVTAEGPGLERVDIDPDYSNRNGYDPGFLGIPVALPTLDAEQRRNAAKNTRAPVCADNTVLPYLHFSVVMNRRRQLAYYTAVNIDGAQSRRPQRTGDRWYFDPRIAQSEQIGEDLYARNSLDRGHLTRRLDPAWGNANDALKANNDTFHFTNCSPQHANFNQNDETWQGIEDFLLNQATAEQKKLTIFTGPVMTEEDPLYRGVRLPVYFWKIAAYRKNGALSVSAYLLDQKELVEGLERFTADKFQVTVEEITARTGLDFSYLAPHQVDLETAPEGLERAEGMPRKPLSSLSQILV